jgi:toxin YoeB
MLIEWTPSAKKDFDFWRRDKHILQKIKALLESIEMSYDTGIGKPERLRFMRGRNVWSRHIDKKNRLVYEVTSHGHSQVARAVILSMLGHYDDK